MHDHHHPNPDPLAQWLEAETAGRETEAEAALGLIFRTLPQPVPRPGFADRVLRAALVPQVVVQVWPVWLRAVIAACLVLASLGVATLPTVGVAVGRMVRPAEVLAAAAGRLVAAFDWMAQGLAIFEALRGMRSALLQALGAPPVLVALLLLLLISVLGFRGLVGLIAPERSLDHASTTG